MILGFLCLFKEEKLNWIVEQFFEKLQEIIKEFKSFWYEDVEQQCVFDGFSENIVSNYFFFFGIVFNFVINGDVYVVLMVIEESLVVVVVLSVVKFWFKRGGFYVKVLFICKVGQVYFSWIGNSVVFKVVMFDIE